MLNLKVTIFRDSMNEISIGGDYVTKIRALIQKYYDILAYIFFGALTTAVNYLVYLPCYNLLHISAAASNVIAWIFAVVFAYLTNKPFVFRSNDWSLKTVGPELSKFVGSRIASGAMETAIIFVTVDLMRWDGNIMKLVTSVLVVVLNYVTSKLIVFKNK